MSDAEPTVAGVPIGRADKVLWPDEGRTKLDLATYYAAVAPAMGRHLAGRPVSMQRFPDGIGGPSFYEKKVPAHFPSWVHTAEVRTADGPQRQVLVEDAASLVYLADQACVTPHTWLATVADLDHPDQMVFDLDPRGDPAEAGEGGLRRVRRATRLVGELLDDLGLTSYLKTSGSRGYHVLVPLRPAEDFDTVRAFARACAERLADAEPDLLTVEQRKDKRGERIFVDVLRNGYGQTVVPPYAVRGRPGAPVSTPLRWDELSRVAPGGHDMDSVRRRLAQRADPWADLRRRAQALARARRPD